MRAAGSSTARSLVQATEIDVLPLDRVVARRDDYLVVRTPRRALRRGRPPQVLHRAQKELRELFRAGRGAWYVALDESGREVQGSCGVVVTAGRGRYQAVDTAEAHRRRGICSRLVVQAA